jgi:hypothetical protein
MASACTSRQTVDVDFMELPSIEEIQEAMKEPKK